MFFSLFCPSCALLFSACSAAPLVARQWDGMRVPRPSTDPWYLTSGVSDLASFAPGSLIDKRAVEIPAVIQNTASQAWQFKFRTTDSRSNPTWAVTTLYTPKNHSTNSALVSYQHFYDSADVNDSPSYAITQDTMNGVALRLMIQWTAEKHPNWYINVPDYEGPGASFGAGIIAGHATLDSIRIARRLSRYTGLTEDVPAAMWGYSGGALATAWAAELRGVYAPDLPITAAVLGGLTPNITSVFNAVTSGPDSSHAYLIPRAVSGLAVQYPELKQDVMAATTTSGWQAAVRALTDAANAKDGLVALKAYINDLLGKPIVKAVLLLEGLIGHGGAAVPRMPPLFIHHAEHDEVAPIQDVRDLVARYCGPCNTGADISFVVNKTTTPNGELGFHFDEGLRGVGLALDTWLPGAFAGKLPKGCTQTTV